MGRKTKAKTRSKTKSETKSKTSSKTRQSELVTEEGKTIETRDSSGKIIEVSDCDLAGNLQLKISYRYDERGNDVHRLITDENGKQVRRLELQYDEKDRLLGYQEFNRKDELEIRCVAEYDYGPKKVRIRWFDRDGHVTREEFRVPDQTGKVLF